MKRLQLLAMLAVLVPSMSWAKDVEKLLPLSDQDMRSSHESGCEFGFSDAHNTYVQMIDHELMFRTLAGLQICKITNPDAFMEAKGAATCNGTSLKLRHTGAVKEYPEADSSGGPAQLSIDQSGASRIMRGDWGVAC